MKKNCVSLLLAVVMVIALAASSWACGSCGCTPGYWKQDQHAGSWAETQFEFPDGSTGPLTQYMLVSAVFGCGPDMTLLEALSAKNSDMDGDGNKAALLRHGVAALLNATHPEVAEDLGDDAQGMITTMFCTAMSSEDWEMTKEYFEGINERYCPLNRAPMMQ